MPGKDIRFSDWWDMHGCIFPDSILTNKDLASSCRVMGPLQTEHFRRVESVVQSKIQARGIRGPRQEEQRLQPPCTVDYDSDIAEVKDGSPESALKALERLVRWMTTMKSVKGEPVKLLLLSTHAGHTTLVELSPRHPAQTAGTSPQPGPASTHWNCCAHDSLN